MNADPTPTSDEDTEGHGRKGPGMDPADDIEGHGRTPGRQKPADGDDTEGHIYRPETDDEGKNG